jgi:hypothetical protein
LTGRDMVRTATNLADRPEVVGIPLLTYKMWVQSKIVPGCRKRGKVVSKPHPNGRIPAKTAESREGGMAFHGSGGRADGL